MPTTNDAARIIIIIIIIIIITSVLLNVPITQVSLKIQHTFGL